MKKFIILFLLAMCTSMFGAASDWNFMVKGGFASTYISTDTSGVFADADAGVTFGWQVLRNFSEKFGASLGVEYNTINATWNSGPFEFDLETAWLDIPLLLHYQIARPVSFHFGGFYGFKLFGDANGDKIENMEDSNYGLIAGFGFHFNENLQLILRYAHGLANLQKSMSGVEDAEWNSSSLSLSLGYTL